MATARGALAERNSLFILLRRMRRPLVVLILSYAVAILGFVLVPGATPDGRPWRMDFLHATYFVSFLGTTIGLGEIPYPFTPMQRLWGTVSIYMTVVAWLYSFGALFAVLQDPTMRRLLLQGRFYRQVKGLREPFYLLCGYDDAGRRVARELTADDMPVVVLDRDHERVEAVDVDALSLPVPALEADASDPQVLLAAGLRHPMCKGVLALTGDDAVNTKIVLSAKMLAPDLQVLGAVSHHAWHSRLAQAGADAMINPFDVFAERMAIALNAPSLHIIYEAITAQRQTVMAPVQPLPRGRWLVCGWGPLARALRHRLRDTEVELHVVDPEPDASCERLTRGDPTDAHVLRKAGIETAQLLVAATLDDLDNLAIAMAARELAPELPLILRRTQSRNALLFREAGARLVMATGYLIATEVLRHTRAPLLGHFLSQAAQQDEAWAAGLLQRLRQDVGDEILETWTQSVWRMQTLRELRQQVAELASVAPMVPLLHMRLGVMRLCPAEEDKLLPGDLLLLAGTHRSRRLYKAALKR